jgi:hypothetical protein
MLSRFRRSRARPTGQVRAGSPRRRWAEIAWGAAAGALVAAGAGIALGWQPLPTTMNDFFLRGSQPLTFMEPLGEAENNCSLCHGGFNESTEPYTRWAASMMGQATRDPIFLACLTIANQDAAFAGDICLRCHAPMGWIAGRSVPTDGSALGGNYDEFGQYWEFPGDFEGVSCCVCHRMVDPMNAPGAPARDAAILAALQNNPPGNGVPPDPGSANYVFDDQDVRRGPLDLYEYWGEGFIFHYWAQSPFHTTARQCATCHDVSNPLYVRQPNGTYALASYDSPHPTQSKYDMFPMERTFSEWAQSLFASGPVNLGDYPPGSGQPRFGGTTGPSVSTCQDCHMPSTSGMVCSPFAEPPDRPVIPQHNFNGANSWVLRAVDHLYPRSETGLTTASIEASIARNVDMLQRASDLELSIEGTSLRARIINRSGHKLPTGYAEGRRMWVNVVFFNANGDPIAERGAYDPATAVLQAADTKVYEQKLGIDAAVAALTGLTPGPSFHFALVNTIEFDNRIPPMGFTNSGFTAVQAQPVGVAYADGQYWDDTLYPIPPLAASARVRVYHQTTTREYIEFLRDANVTNAAGQTAYAMWVQFGKSPPVQMDDATTATGRCPADWDGNGLVQPADIAAFVNTWVTDLSAGTRHADIDMNGVITPADVALMVSRWFAALSGPCP